VTLVAWSDQPVEEARLLNPAFLGVVAWACADGYAKGDGDGLPYPLAFVALPAVLHKPTRDALPRSVRTSLAAWLAENPGVLIGFAERASALVPWVKHALIFASGSGLVRVANARVLVSRPPASFASFQKQASAEVAHCIKAAGLVGKWFARSGAETTVMALWGVAP
jgi:Family of unknown function (DUF6521)